MRQDSPGLLKTRPGFDDIDGPINGDAWLSISRIAVGIAEIFV